MSSPPDVHGIFRDTAATAPAIAPRTAVVAEAIVDGGREGFEDRPDPLGLADVRFVDVRFFAVRARAVRLPGLALGRRLDLRVLARPEVRFAVEDRFAREGRLPFRFAPAVRFAAGRFRALFTPARLATRTPLWRTSIQRSGATRICGLKSRVTRHVHPYLKRRGRAEPAYNGRMKQRSLTLVISALTLVIGADTLRAGQSDPAALVKEAQKLESSGQRSEALELYRKALGLDPSRFDAHLGIGRVLDLEGKYGEARQHIQKAIELAPETGQNAALSTMGVAYAFEGRAAESATYYQKVFDRQTASGAHDAAAGTANALGRVYLETGDAANAEKWYRTGYETAQKIDKRSPGDVDLWEMRWHHAQARIAARRKQFDAARKHADAVRALVEKGTLDEGQRASYPYLLGYVALHEGKHDEAIAALSKADQEDPFVLTLLAQAYEHKKDPAKAQELYRQILDIEGHSLQAAFSRPLARKALGQK